jgi:hypothetical protein
MRQLALTIRHFAGVIILLSFIIILASTISLAELNPSNISGDNSSQLIKYLSNGVNLSINGTVFNDLNGDGLKTKNEPGLSGWTIILESNGKVLLQTVTDNKGFYFFKNLVPDKYTVKENNLAGWNETRPGTGNYTINLVDTDAFNYDFGNHFGPVTYVPVSYPGIPLDKMAKINEENLRAVNIPLRSAAVAQVSSYPSSFSLLSHVPQYTDRNQGEYCENCWVWACTGAVEIAHDIQNGRFDRLSIQYFDSNYNGGFPCCAEYPIQYVNFYSSAGEFIPWSNSQADYRDGNLYCGAYAAVPSGSISNNPYYPISSIRYLTLPHGIGTSASIDSIKNELSQGKGVIFTFALPTGTAWNDFINFWNTRSDNYNFDQWNNILTDSNGKGHAVMCVGWDDSTNSWIMLNSWGTNPKHPYGTFKVKMDMNYDMSFGSKPQIYFANIDVTFSGSIPIYRMYSPIVQDHFYNTNYYEYSTSAVNVGYQQEGILGYAYGSSQTGAVPIYRMYSPIVKDHFYTTNYNEYSTSAVKVGYQQEGILGYAYSSSQTGTIPIYRMYSPIVKDHFYTTNYNEYSTSAVKVGYQQEGILGYAYSNSQPPLFQAVVPITVKKGGVAGTILIPNALITVTDGASNSKQATTNVNGQATITGVSGTWQYSVSATGYTTNTGSWQIASPPASNSVVVYLQAK